MRSCVQHMTAAMRWLRRPPLSATLLACAIVLAARRPDLLQAPQFWAEDGPVFFLHARTLGADSLFLPSAGYLHTVLRGIAWLATWTDPTLAPAFYCCAAGAMTLYVAALTQSPRFPFASSPGYALAVVLVPDAFEVLLTLTNLQWILAAGLLLILIAHEPLRRGERVHDVVALVALGLTGPFVIVFAPLFAWRAWVRRTRFSLILAVGASAAAAVQGITILQNPVGMAVAPIALDTLVAIPGVRVGVSLLAGGRLPAAAGLVPATVCGVLTLFAVAFLAGRPGEARRERVCLGLAFAGLLVVALYRCRYVLPHVFHGAGSRYFFPLQLIALWLLLAAAGARQSALARVASAALLVVVAMNAARLREPAFTDFDWALNASKIRRGERVTVRINPDWEFTVPEAQPLSNRLAAEVAGMKEVAGSAQVER